MDPPLPGKKPRGRRPGPVSEDRVNAAIALLKRSGIPGTDLAARFAPPPPPAPEPTPEELLAALKARGGCLPEITLADLLTPNLGKTLRVELVPLEDGINPVEQLAYLPDLLKSCVKELAGIQKQLKTLCSHEK